MSARSRSVVWLGLLAALCAGVIACGSDASQNGTTVEMQEEVAQQEEPQPEEEEGELVFVVAADDIGWHVEATSHEAPVAAWLEASEASFLGELPRRAISSSGVFFQPSAESPTGETFWLHVFTDESGEAANQWVSNIAPNMALVARSLVPAHEVFLAEFRPATPVGDIATSFEIFSGHSGGCWLSQVVIFAQDKVVVLLRNSFEVTRDEQQGAQASGRVDFESMCDALRAGLQLTDIDGVTALVSAQMYGAR